MPMDQQTRAVAVHRVQCRLECQMQVKWTMTSPLHREKSSDQRLSNVQSVVRYACQVRDARCWRRFYKWLEKCRVCVVRGVKEPTEPADARFWEPRMINRI